MADLDRENITQAYYDVRSDNSNIAWAVMKYDGANIVLDSVGEDYEEFSSKFTDDERAFAFLRVIVGDEMSKRAKFVLITWIGSEISPLKRAKVSTDKSLVKSVIQNFAVEIQTSESEEVSEAYIKGALVKAGGANYGTGE